MNKHHIIIHKADTKTHPRHNKHFSHLRGAVCFVLALLLTLSLFPIANSEENKPAPIKVGYYENEIFQEGAADGMIKTGYAYEYYRKLSEYTGWQYEYVYGDYTDLYQKLLNGEIDLLAGLALTEERIGIVGYPDTAMGHEAYVLVKHTDDTGNGSDPSTLNGKSFGVLDSAMVAVLEHYLESHNITAEVKTYSDYTTLFESFDKKEIDILAAEGDGARNRSHAEVIGSFGSSDYYLCVSISRPDLLEALNSAQAMLTIEEPHFIHTLENKYYPVSVSNSSFTEAESKWLAEHDMVHVGYLEDYLPYSYTDKNGKVTGIVKDIVPEILGNLDLNDLSYDYHAFKNYEDLISAINNGEIDLAFPISGNLYYSEINGIYQSSSVISSTDVLVYKGEYDENTTSLLALNKNNTLQYYSSVSSFPDAEFIYYDSIKECLDAVNSGKATGTVINGMRVHDILKNSKYDSLNRRQTNRTVPHCFGVEIGNEGLLKLINRGIYVTDSDAAKTLAYQYTSELYHYTLWDYIKDNLAVSALIFFVIVGLIIFLLLRNALRKKRQIAVVEKASKALEGKNEELAQSRQALSDALIAAEHANRAKTAFLNNMSHDIRTPMNAIVGFTAMAATHIDDKDKVQDYLNKISVSSRHLLSLINDVLDMSRIESGKMKIEETDVHLPDVIHDLRTIIQPNVKSKQLELFIDTQDVKNEDIILDKLRLNQVLLNILTNAVKFTPAGGTVSFRVIEKPSSQEGMTNFEFRIKDTGIGMTDEFKETIFEAFTREQNSTVSGIQGTGLGMAITKNIVDMMGGTIEVFSEVGKGSEFVVNISCKLSGNTVQHKRLPELEGLRALVADDDTSTCLSVCSMLRDIGMRPDWTNYGKEAVIRAEEAYNQDDKFRVYIIDWMMPDLNGIETVRRIRKVIGDDDPIIVLTAYDWTDIEKEAKEAGVTAFCSKPLFMSELRNVLSQPFRVSDDSSCQEEKTYDFSGKRVLLAEDNELNQMIAISILEGAGFEIDIAADGQIAVDMIESANAGYYDVVLMDIQMPRMDGYTAAGKIRELDDKDKASIPIVAVTANAFEEDRKISMEAGMNGHLTKPYDVPEMMKTLDALLFPKNND